MPTINFTKSFFLAILGLVLFISSVQADIGDDGGPNIGPINTCTPTICKMTVYKMELLQAGGPADFGSYVTLWESAKGQKIDFASVDPGNSVLSMLLQKRLPPGHYTNLRMTIGRYLEICGQTDIGYTDPALAGMTYDLPNAYPIGAFFSSPTGAGGSPSTVKVPIKGGALVVLSDSIEDLGSKLRITRVIDDPIDVDVNDDPQLHVYFDIENSLKMVRYTDPDTQKVLIPSYLKPIGITFAAD